MKKAPDWFKPEARGAEETNSNVAYVSVNMVRGQDLRIALWQINKFKDKNIRAWFVDIMHMPGQMPEALRLKDRLEIELRRASPDLKKINRTICLNVGGDIKKLRARDKMYEIFRDHRTKNVVFRGPDDKQQPIEY